ncbi:sensor histidine kinase [Sphingobacterium sp. LRF_L2]|uniref:sensor histidine kinase n=1 Tax=Sphingobacterium sp. LRF_L2 TaxID=3369421 RepID=UPI003F5EA560
MKIATRTALVFTFFAGITLLLFAFGIFFFSEMNRQEEFVDRLRYKITWRAEFIFDAQIHEERIRVIHEQNKKRINEAQITVYDEKLHPLFADLGEQSYPKDKLNAIKAHNFLTWEYGGELFMGLHYPYAGEQYYLIGHAFDVTGHAHMDRLKRILVSLYFVAIVLIFFASFLFSQYTLKPLKHIIAEIRDISEHNLGKRVYFRKAKDELSELIQTFNGTFDRLEKSFNNQRHFVSIISHEFRTPLASIIAELELAKQLNSSVDDYRKSINDALTDARDATALSGALLDFARANYDTSQVSFAELRIDEVVLDAKLMVLEKQSDYKISVSFSNSSDDDPEEIYMRGNAYLLKVAFANLIENACKYSLDKHAQVEIAVVGDHAVVCVSDRGIGISEGDLPRIFDLFYRVGHAPQVAGHGIGLSIVQRIVEMHNGHIAVDSVVGKGTIFKMNFERFFC